MCSSGVSLISEVFFGGEIWYVPDIRRNLDKVCGLMNLAIPDPALWLRFGSSRLGVRSRNRPVRVREGLSASVRGGDLEVCAPVLSVVG